MPRLTKWSLTAGTLGACLVLILPLRGWAQSVEEPLSFEVASIRIHVPAGADGVMERSGIIEDKGLVRIENLSLQAVVSIAYGVKDPHELVGPSWLSTVAVDIDAKPPAEYKHEQLQPLLRNLLADRFKLVVRHNSKPQDAYALVVAKGGPKFRESTGPRTFFTARPGLISGTGVSMRELTGVLNRPAGRLVVDETGLKVVYDIKLEWTPDDLSQPAGDGKRELSEPGPSFVTALDEQLGLKMQARKVPVDIVIVEHMERVPTAN